MQSEARVKQAAALRRASVQSPVVKGLGLTVKVPQRADGYCIEIWSGSGVAAAHPRSATVAPFPAWRGSQPRDCTTSGA